MCEGVFVYVLVRWGERGSICVRVCLCVLVRWGGGGGGRQKYVCSAISLDSRLFTTVDQQEFPCVKCSDYVRWMVAGYVP